MTEYEEYKQTNMLGSYQPERALLRKTDDGVQPVFRDAAYYYVEDAVVGLHRRKHRERRCVDISVDFGRALRYGVCTASACP